MSIQLGGFLIECSERARSYAQLLTPLSDFLTMSKPSGNQFTFSCVLFVNQILSEQGNVRTSHRYRLKTLEKTMSRSKFSRYTAKPKTLKYGHIKPILHSFFGYPSSK